MGNVARILRRDIVRLLKAPAALVVVCALLVLPSVYTWYNVLAFWDPYANTGNLRVCVVNQDAGTETDVTGRLVVGERILEQLRENDQLQWVEEDFDTAMEELKAGGLYAVYVIPSDFSECIVSPLTGEVKRPQLTYYANEKLGPVSPKITDAGATALDQSINSAFVAAVSEAAVSAVDAAINDAEADLSTSRSKVSQRVRSARADVAEVRTALIDVKAATEEAGNRVAAADTALDDAYSLVGNASTTLKDVSKEAAAVQVTLSDTASITLPSLYSALVQVSKVTTEASTAANGLVVSAGKAQADVDLAVARTQPVANALSSGSAELKRAADALPDSSPVKQRLAQAAQDMAARADKLNSYMGEAQALSARVGEISQSAADATDTLADMTQRTSSALQQYSDDLFGSAVPAMNASLVQIATTCTSLSAAVSGLDTVIGQTQLNLRQLHGVLDDCGTAVSNTESLIGGLQDDLDMVTADVNALGQSGIIANLVNNGTLNSQSIADFMGTPTQLETVEFYHPNAYGTAMAPLFMNLTFWIGAFMLVIILRLEVDSEGVRKVKLWQRYLARLGLFSIFAVLQALICCAGVLFVGVQAANAPALFFAAAITSLAYLSIIYALSTSLRHIGKGLCILLVFAQIPGGSGLYPIELTSSFFQTIYPVLPFSYGIDAMREGIGGFYGNFYAHDLVVLACFFFGSLIVGLLLSPLMANVVRMVAKQVREGDLFNGEDVVTPERPYRLSQVLSALSDRDDYRQEIEHRHQKFNQRYPVFIHVSVVLGVGVPIVLLLLGALNAAEKVVLLTLFLVWLISLFVFLVVVESLRYSFERQMNMEQMSNEKLLGFFSSRNQLVHATSAVTTLPGSGEGQAPAMSTLREAQEEAGDDAEGSGADDA